MEKLIYSIIKGTENPAQLISVLNGLRGISGAKLEVVSCERIAAVVCSVQKNAVVTDRSGTLEYAGLVDNLSKEFTLLPVRFGSVMESNDEIRKMLQKNYKEIEKNLLKVEGRVEFGLKVFCDPEKLQARFNAKGEAEIKTVDNTVKGQNNSVFKDYVNKKLIEYRIEESLLSYVNSVIQEITECCAGLEAISKYKKMPSPTNIIDALFLIDKEMTDQLIRLVKDLQTRYPDLNFILTGPWPPYNFVDITIS